MHARPTSRRESPDAPPDDTVLSDATTRTATSQRSQVLESQRVGTFLLDLPDERWTWSDEVFLMHGFAPGDVVPSTDVLVSHQHPDDHQDLAETVRAAAAASAPFGCVYRMRDASGGSRVLGIVGSSAPGPVGAPARLHGYFVDLTESHREAVDREATASIIASSLSRATIEQAKGIVMAALGVSGDESFAVLRRFSNDTNTPLRDVAEHLVDRFRTSPSVPLLHDVRMHLAQVDPQRETGVDDVHLG